MAGRGVAVDWRAVNSAPRRRMGCDVAKTSTMVFLQAGRSIGTQRQQGALQEGQRSRLLSRHAYDERRAPRDPEGCAEQQGRLRLGPRGGRYASVLPGLPRRARSIPVPLGGPRVFELTSTNEAQKVDALGCTASRRAATSSWKARSASCRTAPDRRGRVDGVRVHARDRRRLIAEVRSFT